MKSKPRKPPRLYLDLPLSAAEVALEDDRAHYLRRVLRLKAGDSVVVFNGAGAEFLASVDILSRDRATLRLDTVLSPIPESPLEITLVQSLVKNDAMDLIIQKASELGIHRIVPVATEFSVVKLDEERARRRVAHWEKIAASACEQSGRHRPPSVESPLALATGLEQISTDVLRLILQPPGRDQLAEARLPAASPAGVAVLIGPEGGLSERDLATADRANFKRVSLGARILRAETAAVAACALVQRKWGDLSG
ncbi:MAG: 16S rRNA (uracil(1498)-N(3))-methyltransferase [Candidatus Rariloculaceae bacterium]